MAPDMDERLEIVREVGGLSAKMDVVLQNVGELKQQISNMPTRPEIDARFEKHGERFGRLESRVRDIEQDGKGLFFKWFAVIGTICSLVVSIYAAVTR